MGDDLDKKVARAIKSFWRTRDSQHSKQGNTTGKKDAGARGAVTAGKHLDGFVLLCRELILEAGISECDVYCRQRRELPGYYRAEKNWDLVVVTGGLLLAVVEFKAHVGPSFGNNANNRAEEAVGNAADLWAAYREGAFKPSARPWLGYVFVLEDCPASQKPVRLKKPHFSVFPEFENSSYAQRYEILLTKLLRERMYDGVSLILTKRSEGSRGRFRSPSEELSFSRFTVGLTAHASAFAKSLRQQF